MAKTEFNRQQTLTLINHDSVLTGSYKAYCKLYCDPKKGFDQEGIDKAIRRIFDECIAEDEMGLYEKDWVKATPKEYEYEDVPKSDELTITLQKLMNVHAWRGLMLGFVRLAEIKKVEFHNCGMPSQVEKWSKIGVAMRKLASPEVMT